MYNKFELKGWLTFVNVKSNQNGLWSSYIEDATKADDIELHNYRFLDSEAVT